MLRPDFMKMNPFVRQNNVQGGGRGSSCDSGEDFVDFRAYLDE